MISSFPVHVISTMIPFNCGLYACMCAILDCSTSTIESDSIWSLSLRSLFSEWNLSKVIRVKMMIMMDVVYIHEVTYFKNRHPTDYMTRGHMIWKNTM